MTQILFRFGLNKFRAMLHNRRFCGERVYGIDWLDLCVIFRVGLQQKKLFWNLIIMLFARFFGAILDHLKIEDEYNI